jgi:hypothetical protein
MQIGQLPHYVALFVISLRTQIGDGRTQIGHLLHHVALSVILLRQSTFYGGGFRV